ncbi:IS256 family transposase [Thermodesulfobium fumaratoxidans]
MLKKVDINDITKRIAAREDWFGKGGIFTPLIKTMVEEALSAEMDSFISQEALKGNKNRRNGYTSKKVKSSSGTFDLNTPRDRNADFEPQIVKKYQTTLSDEIENKILSLYGLGMSYKDIQKHIQDLYTIELSVGAINTITDKIIDKARQWQQRPLENLYPFVWLDGIHYKIKEDGRYIQKCIYTILGVNLSGKKEVLGLYISETESAHFWLSVLTDLQNRGIKDILVVSVDGLNGFIDAIGTIFPKAEVNSCIVHQVRNSLKYVVSKDKKEFIKDLKQVYKASSKEQAEYELSNLENKWANKYPVVIRSWKDKWEHLSNYFKYPNEIRRIVYTTNIIESVHRQFRKLTKTKGAFPSEDSLIKLLYLGIQNATNRWTMPMPNWSLTLSQLSILFGDRIEKYIEI